MEIKAKDTENLFNKIIAKNSPNLVKNTGIHKQEVYRPINGTIRKDLHRILFSNCQKLQEKAF